MTAADMGFADSLREIAGWNQTIADWQRLLELEPEGCFVAVKDRVPVGTATVKTYEGKVAWIGMVLVHPKARNQGIGAALLDHCLEYLRQRRIPCVKLDATPEGQPIYEKLGFRPEWSLARWEGTVERGAVAEGEAAGRVLTTEDFRPDGPPNFAAAMLRRISKLDAEVFGVSRKSLLTELVSATETVALEPAAPVGDAGLLAWGALRPGARAMYIGPLVATDSGAGIAVLEKLLAASAGRLTFLDVPDARTGVIALLESMNFRRQRPFVRMVLGDNSTPGDLLKVFAIADPALG